MRQIEINSSLNMDAEEVESRRRFFEITDEELVRLRALRSFAEKYTHEIIEELYELILGHPDTRAYFEDPRVVARVKASQNKYFLELFSGRCDLTYVENRLKVGTVHEQISMPPKWYLGAYRRYLSLIYDKLLKEFSDPEEIKKNFISIQKIISFDMSLSIDTYIAAHVETVNRHRAAIREMSTPVIRVYDRILLLPLVGTVDTQRARQIMETVLSKVVEEQAKVIILDIAGVPVVDTRVADHLLKTTAAIRLLGAETILTGITALVAQTIIQLGVEISSMSTRSRLADGIELALNIIGKEIQDKNGV